MEAKDTVMSEEEIENILLIPNQGYLDRTYRTVAQKQAEITWPVAFKAGVREVVEWLRHNMKNNPDLQAKLKDWEIEYPADPNK